MTATPEKVAGALKALRQVLSFQPTTYPLLHYRHIPLVQLHHAINKRYLSEVDKNGRI